MNSVQRSVGKNGAEIRPVSGLKPMTILIADDHSLIRDALAQVIRSNSESEVLVADSFKSVLAIASKQESIDILLLDIYMPDMEGLKSVRTAISLPSVKAVALLSGSATRGIVLQALGLGAKGYISKDMHLDSLINALNFIASGETYIPISILGDDAKLIEQGSPETDKDALNTAEMEVLRLVVDGLPNKEIARHCCTTEIRVKMHMRSICKKLGVSNRTGAALKARELSMI